MRSGKVVGVNGNMVTVEFADNVVQNEVAYVCVGQDRLKSEVIRVRGKKAELQVFEDTVGIRIGDTVEFTGDLLSVALGPGLLGQIYDGLQNPLPQLAQKHGFFLKRGAYLGALDESQKWEFTPAVKAGDKVRAGDKVGTVPEKIFKHWIMVPFGLAGELEVVEVAGKGNYAITQTVAKVKDAQGKVHPVTMVQTWPVKVAIKAYERFLELAPDDPNADATLNPIPLAAPVTRTDLRSKRSSIATYPRGKPRPRVAMIVRCISDVPPMIVPTVEATTACSIRPPRRTRRSSVRRRPASPARCIATLPSRW